ncbi:MAG: helix-turn-helix transcriptional regulator, partial [Clostridia bacterium]|nr:helix-turn-helix transcriptional regulator [Clostridia bacterium]
NGEPIATINAGDYFIVDYGMTHNYKSLIGAPVEVINVLFLPTLIDNTLHYCKSFSNLLNHYLIKINSNNLNINPSGTVFHDTTGEIHTLIQQLCNEYNEKQIGFTEIMRCALIEIIVITMRKIGQLKQSDDATEYIVNLVKEDCAHPPSLSAVADKLGYSVPHLCTKFKKTVGMGFREFVSTVRIDEARRLLANTDKKITEIAELVGYTDVAFFYSTFKKHAGVSPSVFRKTIK